MSSNTFEIQEVKDIWQRKQRSREVFPSFWMEIIDENFQIEQKGM